MSSLSYFADPAIDGFFDAGAVYVFDMNGLIVADEGVQLQAVNEVLSPFGISVSEERWISDCTGRKPAEFMRGLMGEALFAVHPDIVMQKEKTYQRLIVDRVKGLARPGILSFFSHLRAKGCRMAVASATTSFGIEIVLGSQGLDCLSLFDFVVSGDAVQRAKPDPAIYLKVAEHFGRENRFFVFEDAMTGLIAAKGAGMVAVSVPNGFTIRQDHRMADLRLSDFTREAKKAGNGAGSIYSCGG